MEALYRVFRMHWSRYFGMCFFVSAHIFALCCPLNASECCIAVIQCPHTLKHLRSEHTDTTTTAIMGTRSKATTESTTKSVYTGTIPNVGIATTTLTATVDITSTADTGTSTAIISVPKTKSNSIINTILTTTLATKIVSSESILVTTASLSTEHSCAGKSNKRPLQQCKHVLISGLCNDFADQCESSCNGCDTTLPIATANSVVTTGPINDITIPAATTDNRMPTETNKMLTAFDKTSFDSTSNAVASTLSVQARATLTVTIDSDKSTTTFAAEDIDLKAFLQSNYQSKNLQGTVNILTITTIMSVVILVIAISSVIVAALVVKHKMQKTKKQASRQVNDVEKNNVADRTTQKQRSPNMAGLDSHTLDTHSHPKNGGVTNCELKDIVIETNNRMINSSDTTTTKKFDDVISVMESKRIWK